MPRMTGAKPARMMAFGPFRLFPEQGLLLEGHTPVHIGNRALDILTTLVERAGDVVCKEDLVKRTWPDTTVVDANLRVHVAGLRKLLRDGQGDARYITNVIGRGYRFVAPVACHAETQPAVPARPTEHNVDLPVRLTRMVGRDDVVTKVVALLPLSRFITIAGTGGIGKTSVALAVAAKAATSYQDGVRFIDLTAVANPLAVPSALSAALGVASLTKDTIPKLIAFLENKHMLLVLDNCEHVIKVAATLTEQILKAAPQVHVLTTSREPLDAEGEIVQRLAPLALPPRGSKLSVAAALTFPAVQLFAERVSEKIDDFRMNDDEASIIAELCYRLDGLPLAIELAAGRADAFGVAGLATLLNDHFSLLMRGRRTALPRHQTLSATLDWSYDALTDPERAVIRRLAVFAAGFTLDKAGSIASGPDIAAAEVTGHLASLVSKSLVIADIGNGTVQYRLLSTTRAYALKKLADSDELPAVSRRYVELCLHLAEAAEADRTHHAPRDWMTAHGNLIDNLRAALDWAFAPDGDAARGVALTITAVPLWTHLSLNEECRAYVEMALSCLDADVTETAYDKLRLLVALGGALTYTWAPAPEVIATWQSALKIARDLGSIDHQLRSLWGLWITEKSQGNNRLGLTIAEDFTRIASASGDSGDSLVGERMQGYSLYVLGALDQSRLKVEHMLARYTSLPAQPHIVRYQFDQRIVARIPLACVLWLQGFPDQAMRIVETNIDAARDLDHAISLSYALAQSACPIALYAGDLTAAERFSTMLQDHPWRYAAGVWRLWGRSYAAVLRIKQGDLHEGLALLQAALAEFPDNAFHMRHTAFLGELAEAMGLAGEFDAGLTTINRALDAARRCEEKWCFADLLRIKGDIILRQGGLQSADQAEGCFRDAIDQAREQNALSWELRAATSLARSWQGQGRTNDARSLLAATYARFMEGFSTPDLIKAKTLLDELA